LKKDELVESGVHVVGIENVMACSFDGLGNRYITEEKFQTLRAVEVKPGDVLITMMGTIGEVAVVPPQTTKSIMDSHLLRFRPDLSLCVPEYVKWLVKGSAQLRDHLRRSAHGSIMKGLNSSIIRSLPAPLPPLAEQHRIVGLLDEADELRRRREQADRRTAELIPALFYKMFGDPTTNPKGWPVVEMREILDGVPNYGTMIPPRAEGGGWLDIRVANIRDGELDLSDRKYVDLPHDALERHEVKSGDLLLARAIGSIEHLGKCIVAEPQGERWAFDSHLMRVRFCPARAIPEVIRAFIMSPGGRRIFLNKTRESAVQFNINAGEFSSIRLPLPPPALQREFAARVAEIRALQACQAESRCRLDDLFQSMLHRAFQGEL
jgi:type I restriction enzyme S subunit